MKYSSAYIRDFNWYVKHRAALTFCGSEVVVKEGDKDARECFYLLDTHGKSEGTKHPNLLKALIIAKGSLNLNIKMWAEDRAKGLLPKVEFKKIVKELDLLSWMIKAVENQKYSYG